MSLNLAVSEIVEQSSNPLLAIADGWERVPLADVAEVVNGFAFPSTAFDDKCGVPLIRIRDILSDRTECFYQGPYERRYVVEPGELLIGMDGDFQCARWQGPRGLLNQRTCKVVPTTDLYDSRFLEIALPGYLRAINENTPSSTVKHLSSNSVLEIPLPLPPLAEQQRIVAQVEALLARTSAVRDRLARVSDVLKRFRQAVLAAACLGRLTLDWRDLHPEIETAEESLAGMNERQPKWRKARRLGDISDASASVLPTSWTWTTFEQVCRDITVGHVGPMAKEYRESGIPFLRSLNVREFRFDPTDLKYVPL